MGKSTEFLTLVGVRNLVDPSVWNGNELVYSALLTCLNSVLQPDWPQVYQAVAQKMVCVLPDAFHSTRDKNGGCVWVQD